MTEGKTKNWEPELAGLKVDAVYKQRRIDIDNSHKKQRIVDIGNKKQRLVIDAEMRTKISILFFIRMN